MDSTTQRLPGLAPGDADALPAPGVPPLSSAEAGFDPAYLERRLRFAFPPVLVQLAQGLLEPMPDASVIGGCLALDPVLAGCALRLAGPLPPEPGGGGHFSRLAAMAGVTPLLDLVLSHPLRLRLCREEPPDPARHFAAWRATLHAALAAEELALRLAPDLSGEAYRAVLLRALARLMAQGAEAETGPEPSQEAVARAARSLAGGLGLSKDVVAAMLAGPESLRAEPESLKLGEGAPLLPRLVAAALLWAERAPAGSDPPPELRDTLCESLGLNSLEMGNLFSRCAIRLDMLLRQLGLDGGYTSAKSCRETLFFLHSLSLLATRLRPEQGGPSALASRLGEQLRGYWGVTGWELALRLPDSPLALFFRDKAEGAPEERGPLPWSELSWSPGFSRYALAVGGAQRGQLRLPPEPRLSPDKAESLSLYLRFASLALEEYHGQSASRERRAESFSSLPQAVARCGAEGVFLDANEPFLALFSLPAPPAHSTVFALFEHRFGFDLERVRRDALEASSGMARRRVAEGLAGTPDGSLDLQLHSIKGGREFLLLLSPSGSRDEPKEAALREWELFSLVFRAMPELVFTLDNEGRVVWVAGQRQDLAGKDFFSLAQPASSFFQGVWEPAFLTGLTQTRLVEVSFADEGAGLSLYELSLTPMDSRSGHSFLAVARDLNTPRRLDERVRHQVTHDGLTGLFSHSQCQVLLDAEEEKVRREGGSLGIIAFDIHNFHLSNTMYGYQTGDVILRRVAAGINASLRKGKDLAFRYGGDEFAVLAPGVSAEELEHTARSICRLVRRNCGEAVELGCGLALCGPKSPPFRRMLSSARAASIAPGRTPGEPGWVEG